LAVIRNLNDMFACLAIAFAALTGLYWVWLRRIDESDAIVADTRQVTAAVAELPTAT
jgi:hypothetical protein